MGLEENKAVVQRLFDVINSGNLDELPQVVASDVVDHNAVIFMQPEGPGGVQEGVRMLLQGFPDLRLTTQELIAEGDQVVARFSMSGTNTGDYRGLPAPTQQRFESEAIAIMRVADGKVAEIRGTADCLGMLTQLGILLTSGNAAATDALARRYRMVAPLQASRAWEAPSDRSGQGAPTARSHRHRPSFP